MRAAWTNWTLASWVRTLIRNESTLAVNNVGLSTEYPDYFLEQPIETSRNVLVVNTMGTMTVCRRRCVTQSFAVDVSHSAANAHP
jgi:short-subunit dehydrogenase